MHQQIRRVVSHPLTIALTSAAAMLGVSACGGSSGSSTAASTAHAGSAASLAGARARAGAATKGTGDTATTGRAAGPRFTGLRECLRRDGVKLPAGGGLFLGGSLPHGVSRAQLRTDLRKCLGGSGHFFQGPRAGAAPRYNSSTFRRALATFASCLRRSGVNVPAPNTSGRGPVFSTKGIDTASPKFREATRKCRGALTAAFKGRP